MTYVYQREKTARERRAQGISGYVPTATVQHHIRALERAGWTRPAIAAAAHVHVNTVKNAVNAYRPTVHYGTAVAILALKPAGARCSLGVAR